MDNKIIIAVLVVIVAVIACLMAFNPVEEITGDNVIELAGITFNTTNTTDFVKTNEKNESSYYMGYYTSGNGTGKAYVNILDFGENGDADLINSILNAHKNFPSQTIDDVAVYTESSSTGEDSNEPVYVSVVQDTGLNKIVIVGSDDASETAKMASTLKIN